MTAIEFKIFRELASHLKETLADIGGCEHNEGICSCAEQQLMREANSILVNYAGVVILDKDDPHKILKLVR